MTFSLHQKNSQYVLATLSLILLFSCGDQVDKTETNNANESDISIEESDSSSYFENVILADPDSPDPYLKRAGWHLRNGRITDGLDDLNLSIQADTTYGPALSGKADVLFMINDFENCIHHLDACIRYDPDHTPCRLRRAQLYILQNHYEKALVHLNEALRINPYLYEAYDLKGRLYLEAGEIDNALSSYQTAVEVNPEFYEGYISLGILNANLGRDIAEDYYLTAITLRPNSVEALYDLAMYYQDRYMDEKAIEMYARILEVDNSNATAAHNTGFIYLDHKGDYENGEYWFSEAIARLPNYHQAFLARGLCRESLGRLDEALSDYNEALRIKPDYKNAAIAKGRLVDGK